MLFRSCHSTLSPPLRSSLRGEFDEKIERNRNNLNENIKGNICEKESSWISRNFIIIVNIDKDKILTRGGVSFQSNSLESNKSEFTRV